MGYCPYLCIVCENIKDNGWWNNKHNSLYSDLVDLNDVKLIFNLNIDLTTLIYGNYCSNPTTYALCPKCYHKYRYKKEKSQGICLKLYSKRKINGKWIKLNYTQK
jgi:hypothetical protein